MQLDLSCIQAGRCLPAVNSDRKVIESLSEGVTPFADMILERLVSGREDASDECMGIGQASQDSESSLLQVAGRCFQTIVSPDSDDLSELVRSCLRRFALSNWNASHHRN